MNSFFFTFVFNAIVIDAINLQYHVQTNSTSSVFIQSHAELDCCSMDKLPKDIAQGMLDCALNVAKSTANERFGSEGESIAALLNFEKSAAVFTEKASDLLSKSVCDDIKWMFWNAAWATANERRGYNGDAKKDRKRMEESCQKIVNSKLVTASLAENIKKMGLYSGWYWANTKKGYKDDAIANKAIYESYFDKIVGDANLIEMNFLMDQAKILQEKPIVVSEQTLVNNGGIENAMSFTFSVTEGKTKSLSHTASFEFGITMGFDSEIIGKYEVSFKFSSSQTVSESLSTGKTKTYTFPLNVPAHTTYNAKAIVHEAEMDVPYEFVFDIGGTKKIIEGTWRGVATSTATYEINEVNA